MTKKITRSKEAKSAGETEITKEYEEEKVLGSRLPRHMLQLQP